MNYEKKRKRQNGRQAKREPKYRIYIDEYAKIHAVIDKAIKDGILPRVDYDPSTLRTNFSE